MTLFNVAICTIFAREVLEGTIIIGQYRTVINNCDDFQDKPEERAAALKAVKNASLLAVLVAVIIILAVAIPLIVLSKNFSEATGDIIEGISKVVAAICILQLSVKVPKWLGFYASKKVSDDGLVSGLSLRSIKFNVAWNIWRETAEVGVFLIPYFLANIPGEIPLSALIGIVVGFVGGMGIYYASLKMKNKFWLAVFLSAVFGQLSTGLFTGGCHEFEEVWGETRKVWKIEGDFWQHKRLPMALLKPFGYSASRTVLQICCFWSWTALVLAAHYYKYTKSQKIFAERAAAKEALGKEQEFDEDKV